MVTNQVVPPPPSPALCTRPGSQHFLPQLGSQPRGSAEVSQPSPSLTPLTSLGSRNPRIGHQQALPGVSAPAPPPPPDAPALSERGESPRVSSLPAIRRKYIHFQPAGNALTVRSRSCGCGKAAGEERFPSPELLRKEKLNTYL